MRAGWDHHIGIFKGYKQRMGAFESTIAELILDLDRRGLLATTLVIALGEFGRTPKINKDAGRDHWSNAMSVLFAGCGTPGGQVVGSTDAHGYAANERVLSPGEFCRHGLHQARHRSGEDLPYTQWPARPTGERPDPHPGTDGMTRVRSPDVRTLGRSFISALVGVVVLCTSRSHAKPPTLTDVFPPGASRGQTVAVKVSGTFDHWPVKVWVEGQGVEIQAEKEKGKLKVVVADRCPAGPALGAALR